MENKYIIKNGKLDVFVNHNPGLNIIRCIALTLEGSF